MELKGKVAIVTGANDGLGELLSYQLVDRGVHVIGVARREEKLKKVQDAARERGGEFSYIPADLADYAAIRRVVDAAYNDYNGAEILVNNAGLFAMDFFSRIPPETHEKLLLVDLHAPISLYHLWLRRYQEDVRAGKAPRTPEIGLWMNSVSGLRPYGGNSVYEAAKHGLRGFVQDQRIEQRYLRERLQTDETVRNELGAFGNIRLRHINLYPDSTDTAIIQRTKGNLFADPGVYEYIPARLVAEAGRQALEGAGDFGRFDDIEIGIREVDGQKGVYAIFYPLDNEGGLDRQNQRMQLLERFTG